MKALILILALFFSAPNAVEASALLTAKPTTQAGLVENGFTGNRGPASSAATNCSNVKIGARFMIRNSVRDWENRLAVVTDKFDDCSVRVKLDDGRKAFVKAKNFASTLSPEVKCLPSHGVKVCEGDKVFYPVRTSSMDLPEAPIKYAFAHGVVLIRDGADFIYDSKQVGKSVECSPQKESICVGNYVYAEGYKVDRKFNFEGPVLKAYTHGVVIVESDKLWKFPIDVSAVKKRVESIDGDMSPAMITGRGTREKEMPYRVTPEITPGNADTADRVDSAR